MKTMIDNELMETKKNFNNVMETLNAALELSRCNTENISTIIGEIKTQHQAIGNLTKSVSDIDTTVKKLNDDFENFKLNEEVTDAQATSIRSSCAKRVCEILGENALDRKKYFNTFIKNLYKDARKYGVLGSKITTTKKGNFQRCIDFAESWVPSCGCATLKERADRNATANREAKKLGYI